MDGDGLARGTAPVAVLPDVDEWRRIESSITAARWFGVVFAVFQVTAYDAPGGAPAAVRPVGVGLAGLLAVVTVVVMWASRRVRTVAVARRLAVATLLFDGALLSAYVWLYAFDPESSLYLVFFVLPAEAALKFRAWGAIAAWAGCTTLYVLRELWAAGRFGHEVVVTSITFRMGVLLMVSVILGLFARKLAERTRDLGGALDALGQQERWRQALIDMLAHDLRAPVGAATATMMILRDRGDALPPGRGPELAAAAVRQNERALRLTQDLLDLARSQQGRLELQREEVDVGRLLGRVIDTVAGERARVDVVVEPGLHATLDPDRYEQIVANLVSNALKHGEQPIEVTARSTAGGVLELRVTDCGTGVRADEVGGLFTPFAAGADADSVGLGLWVVRTLAESHGGTVAYEPVEGRPSFVVRVPGAVREQEPVTPGGPAG